MATRLTLLAVCVWVALSGCDTRSTARVTSAESGQGDTVVRRVARVTRKASMMQRVTGAVSATHALVPLDSTLAVRVLDDRGDAMSGVRVRWSLAGAGAGAVLQVRNERTDVLGISRAAFAPGAAASSQVVVAEVQGVGRLEMPFRVPVADIRVVIESLVLWSGDTATARAVLSDSRGTELARAAVQWVATDSTVVRLVAVDSTRARVLGALAGSAELVAWREALRGRATVTVRPVLTGSIQTLDASTPAAALVIRTGAAAETVSVQHGRFHQRVGVNGSEVHLHVTSDDPRYAPAHLRVSRPRDLQDLRIVLIPTTWRIDAGTFAGREVAIDPVAATTRVGGRAPFWRLAPVSGRGLKQLLGWREADLPLRIAFRRTGPGERITSADSVAFWSIAQQMERDLGESFFAPATMPHESDPGLIAVELRSQAAAGHTFVAWSQEGNATDGTLLFQSATTLRDPHVVTHELLHLLGFGHSASWPTVAMPSRGTERRLTADDVAYVQLALRLRRAYAQKGWRAGLPIPSQ